ncbi:SMP-30/gluconolactonase/LRE family protein [Kiloniella antarctica]|uniref:SMP-30/gluconolactonase/LRE family protein n=1 Tax=Kiloniella antarctica TaxID=1550907 RepID=A0ABW5BN38_9PROT
MSNELICVADVKNTLGEGPVWDEVENTLYWVDITEQKLFRYAPSTRKIDVWKTPSKFGSFALRQNTSGMIIATKNGIVLYDLQTGIEEQISSVEDELIENRMNDGKCDPVGRFWCGTIHEVSDPALRKPIASVYRVTPDRQVRKMLNGIKTSNGFAWSPDGKTMYFADTPTQTISAYDYCLETGRISWGRTFATVPKENGRPDGATVDAEGCLWSAHFAGGQVTRYSPEGDILQVIHLPVRNVTSCIFGGGDLSTLYITTAREDLTPQELEEQPSAGGLFAIKPGVSGLKMNRFNG